MSLTDEDKKRIQAEEEYRAKVRHELEVGQQPKGSSKKGAEGPGCGKLILFLACLLGGSMYLLALTSPKISPEDKARIAAADRAARDRQYCNDDGTIALIMAQKLVKGGLKAPATAEFASHRDSQVTPIGDCSYRVVSYVDSENSFGANIRTKFTATVKYNGNDKWGLISLK